MFLPIGDTPKPRHFVPVATWALIALNVALYLLVTFPLSLKAVDPRDPALHEYLRQLGPMLPRRFSLASLSVYDLLVFQHGYKPAAPSIGDLLGSMFLHANFWHLAGNMLFLGIYGRNVEYRLGRAGYLAAYLGTGALATLAFSVLAGPSWAPLIGASGAIAGVLGLYFVLFPRHRVKMLVALPPFFFDVFLVPARLVLGVFVLVDNLFPLLFGAQSGVAYGAHLGGFVAGVVAALVGERLAWKWPWQASDGRRGSGRAGPVEPEPGGERSGEPGVDRIRDALLAGERVEALSALARLSTAGVAGLEPEECVVLSRWLRDAGDPSSATNLLRACLAAHRDADDLAPVYLALGLMRLEQGQPTSAYQHLLSVFDFDPSPEIAARARAALAQIGLPRSPAH